MIELIFKLIACHIFGDYVLQVDFLAHTKGKSWYSLFLHCFLYILPFYIVFGFTIHLLFLFLVHFYVDALKARYELINLTTDQTIHYLTLLIYFIRG